MSSAVTFLLLLSPSLLFLCLGLTTLLRALDVLGANCSESQWTGSLVIPTGCASGVYLDWHVRLPKRDFCVGRSLVCMASTTSFYTGSPPPRGVMAVPPDDDDDAWEDEDAQLQGLGTTTHRSRNPHKAVIARRGKRRSRVVGAKRSADEGSGQGERSCNGEKASGDASEESAGPGRRILTSDLGLQGSAQVSLYNAKISALMAQLNEDRDVGHRYLMTDIKRMVKEDPSMLDASRRRRRRRWWPASVKSTKQSIEGLGPNNLAASADAKRNTGAETLLSMQKECTEMIKTSLQTVTGRTKIAMNYENYVKAIVEALNFGLLGWPKGVDFKRMSKQDLQWAVLTASQKKQLLSEFKKMVENGEATEKEQKGRGKGKRTEAGGGEEVDACGGSKRTGEPLSDDDGDSVAGEEGGGGGGAREDVDAASGPKAQRERLLALVAERRAAASSKGKRGDKASKSTRGDGKAEEAPLKRPTTTHRPGSPVGSASGCADDDSGSDNDDRPAPKAAGSASAAPPTTTTTGTRTYAPWSRLAAGNTDARLVRARRTTTTPAPQKRSPGGPRRPATPARRQQRPSCQPAENLRHERLEGRGQGRRPERVKAEAKAPVQGCAHRWWIYLTREPSLQIPLTQRPSVSLRIPLRHHRCSCAPPAQVAFASASRHGSAADGATATSSAAPRGRANVVRGRRGGPPGLRAVL
ncbi:hypothetical protein B0H14DRAFT_2563554 [Mycena olivaceomarginata]|nr:hypothetical protein B0H14DRAFT_2563554 [Mycena olivaceomarginata]